MRYTTIFFKKIIDSNFLISLLSKKFIALTLLDVNVKGQRKVFKILSIQDKVRILSILKALSIHPTIHN